MPSFLWMLLGYARSSPLWLLMGIFQLWMLIDAIRREEWMWAAFMLFTPVLSPLMYFFFVYRAAPSATIGFQLPGALDRRRIKELQAQIHHLDKPHHYLQLGDLYFQRGNLSKAQECYRASLERDPHDIDARAHMGQCLLRQQNSAAARPLLEEVCRENPKHDYGHSLMAYAEVLGALGEQDASLAAWKQVLENHNYARARVQLAELYLVRNQKDAARFELRETLSDDAHAPAFERRRDRVWIRKAKRLLRAA
jgi:hypothetical protein